MAKTKTIVSSIALAAASLGLSPLTAQAEVVSYSSNSSYSLDQEQTDTLISSPSADSYHLEVDKDGLENTTYTLLGGAEPTSYENNWWTYPQEVASQEDFVSEEAVQEPQKVEQVHPIGDGATITSGFGEVRSMVLSNGSYYSDVHNGVDYVLQDGAPIRAYRAGTVVYSMVGPDGGEGVVIQHDNGLYSYSWHLTSGSRTVQVGDTVEAGQIIGTQGATGMVTGSHLHFGLSRGYWSDYVNPLDYL